MGERCGHVEVKELFLIQESSGPSNSSGPSAAREAVVLLDIAAHGAAVEGGSVGTMNCVVTNGITAVSAP